VSTSAIGGPYISLALLKGYMGIADSNTAQDTTLTARILGSSSAINRFCHRQFGRAETASTRTFPVGIYGVDVHDFWDATGLTVTPFLGQTAGVPWDISTLILEPRDGVVDQVPGWPYRRICYPYGWLGGGLMAFAGITTAAVFAKWGWTAIPEDVITANLMLASMDVAAKGAPFGVAGFGDYAIRIRSNPMVQEKLLPYQVDTVQVAS